MHNVSRMTSASSKCRSVCESGEFVEAARTMARGDHECPVTDRLGRGQKDFSVDVDRGGGRRRHQLDVECLPPLSLPQQRKGRLRLGVEQRLRQWRTVVRKVGLLADHHDATGPALRAGTLGGAHPRQGRADDDEGVVRTCRVLGHDRSVR